MITHLESGTCESGIDIIDLNYEAVRFVNAAEFTNPTYCDDLMERRDLVAEYNCNGTACSFRCPTCQAEFPKLSSLFQHIDTGSCEQELDGGVIEEFITYLEHTWDIST
jgi:hypothetical protein